MALTPEQEEKLTAWCKSHKHLPRFMRDFHDQKDLFKTINYFMELRDDDISWLQAHIYVIDKFLWYMAKRGYTLQRSRAKLDFRSFQEDNEYRRNQEHEMFKEYLASRKQTS